MQKRNEELKASCETTAKNPKSVDWSDNFEEFIKGGQVKVVWTMPQLRPLLLSLTAIFALSWLASDYWDEFTYHFSGQEITHLEDLRDLPPETVLPVDAYVEITGVLGNKAASITGLMRPKSLRTAPVQIRQLLATSVFIEFDQDTYLDEFTVFKQIRVKGRLASFGPNSEVGKVRDYFKQHLGANMPVHARLLIVDEVPGQMWRYPVVFGIIFLLSAFILFTLLRRCRTVIRPE